MMQKLSLAAALAYIHQPYEQFIKMKKPILGSPFERSQKKKRKNARRAFAAGDRNAFSR